MNCEYCSLFGVLLSINFDVKSIFFEVKVHLHLFFEQKWSHFDGKVEPLAFERSKMISILSDNLEILFFNRVFYLIDDV